MARDDLTVIGGVDTHRDTHHAVVLDERGRRLGDASFGTEPAGLRALLEWLRGFGVLAAVGVEGTGTYGAELTRLLHAQGVPVTEVCRPNRRLRRLRGKSDPIDAEAVARAVLSGEADTVPKDRTGIVEAIRMLRVARDGAVKARTAAANQLRDLLVTAPAGVREPLRRLSSGRRVQACSRLRPDADRLAEPAQAAKTALRHVAGRILALDTEISALDIQLAELVATAAPGTTALLGVSTDHAGQLLVTAGDNPDRLRSEAAFAHLCAAAPIPASSGRTQRHRINPAGDRQANRALHLITLSRMRWCPTTRAYVTRRTAEGLSKRDIIRCLKRYLARKIYRTIRADLAALHTT